MGKVKPCMHEGALRIGSDAWDCSRCGEWVDSEGEVIEQRVCTCGSPGQCLAHGS